MTSTDAARTRTRHRIPILLGSGRPLFGSLPRDVRLRHVRTRDFPTGLVQSEYEVIHG